LLLNGNDKKFVSLQKEMRDGFFTLGSAIREIHVFLNPVSLGQNSST